MRNFIVRTFVLVSLLLAGLGFTNTPAQALSAYAAKLPSSVFWSGYSSEKATKKTKWRSTKKYRKAKKKKYAKTRSHWKVASKRTKKRRTARKVRKQRTYKKAAKKNTSKNYRTAKPAPVRKVAIRTASQPPQTTVKGAGRYRLILQKYAAQYGVPLSIANAVVQIESNYRPHLRSPKGAVGLMQVLPSTARSLGYRGSARELYDPETNIKYGMKYLAGAYRRAGGSICGTVWKYNAGYYSKRMPKESQIFCRKARRILGKSL